MQTSNIELFLSNLNEQQREAVTAPFGPTVVFAGPGSGKTTVLTRRVLYLLEQGVQPENLMVVTFTRAAAQEMKERLAQIMPEKVQSLMIGTFHSLFLAMLREEGIRIPAFLSPSEQNQWIRQWLEEQEQPTDDETVSTYLNQIGLCKGNLIFPQFMKVQKKKNVVFRDLYQAYEERKQQLGYWDYDDILVAVYRMLQDESCLHKWQNRCRHILVDEFQDINRVQYEVLIRLAKKHACLFVVGDDDQAIYGFRGSDPSYMLHLRKEFPQLKQIVLSVNYRSTDEIIHISDQLIRKNKERQWKPRKGTGSKGPKPFWLEPDDEEKEAEMILSYSDGMETAILYRTATQARAIVDALVRKEIPFSISTGDHTFYQRWQVQDLLAYFRLAYDPNDLDAIVRIINKPKRYLFGEEWIDACWDLSRRTGKSLLDVLPELPGLEHYQVRLLKEMQRKVKDLSALGSVEGIRWIRQEIGYDRYLEKFAEETGNDRTLVFEPVEEMLLAARHCKDGQALLEHVARVEAYLRKPHPEAQVHCMTFHKSKGLEFDRVFLIGLHAMYLPHRRSLQVPDHRKQAAWEEERRLLYVAMTRAKSELYLSVSQTRQGKKLGPSPFLKEIGFKEREGDAAYHEIAATTEERTKRITNHLSRQQLKSQPQLRFAHEELAPGMKIRHIKFGIGTIIQVTPLEGVAPGRKVLIRFAGQVKTLHYELSRQLRLLSKE
ncbi:ATP-dependent helicase [Thermoflavimicrobium dichotomicum]|uniref:DNA 3'-5' helicase n=1 Tax=Thermoflavimicrobium dichotomicum TaxID=46223 RepID=A0A1I3SEP1_9BACL|nr:ATP-dependent helicase [Thermoflavimicrobium dichotomicum]SFJ57208.1 DNA helicase-2 / ATP-dependent DNA helicase PcrA [Thermoflavimicrobium dichotomicum]